MQSSSYHTGFTGSIACYPMADANLTTTCCDEPPCYDEAMGFQFNEDPHHNVIIDHHQRFMGHYLLLHSLYFPSIGAGQQRVDQTVEPAAASQEGSREHIELCEYMNHRSSRPTTPPLPQTFVPIQAPPAVVKGREMPPKQEPHSPTALGTKRNSPPTEVKDEIKRVLWEKRSLQKKMPWIGIANFVNRAYKKHLIQDYTVPALQMMHRRDKDKLGIPGRHKVQHLTLLPRNCH